MAEISNNRVNEHAEERDDELSLLDIGVVLAENAVLLVAGPIIGAIIALAITLALPPIYGSTSLLRLSGTDAAVMKSVDVLGPVIDELKLQSSEPYDAVIQRVSSQVIATFDIKKGLLKLSTQAETPEAAQLLNTKVQDSFKRFSLPKGRSLESVEEQLRITQGTVDELRSGAERLRKSLDKVNPGTEAEAMTRSYVTMIEQRDARQKQLFDLKAALKGFGEEVIIQRATLPTAPVASKRLLVTLMAAVLSGFACLLFVFTRNGLRSVKNSPPELKKVQRIQSALGFSPRRVL